MKRLECEDPRVADTPQRLRRLHVEGAGDGTRGRGPELAFDSWETMPLCARRLEIVQAMAGRCVEGVRVGKPSIRISTSMPTSMLVNERRDRPGKRFPVFPYDPPRRVRHQAQGHMVTVAVASPFQVITFLVQRGDVTETLGDIGGEHRVTLAVEDCQPFQRAALGEVLRPCRAPVASVAAPGCWR